MSLSKPLVVVSRLALRPALRRWASTAPPAAAAASSAVAAALGPESASAAAAVGEFTLGLSDAAPNAEPTPLALSSEAFYAKTRLRLDSASTLPPITYTHSGFLDLEKVKVFERAWTCVGFTTQIAQPGETLVREVGTQPIIIARNKKGQINAFKNVCRHRGYKLCAKSGRYPTLMCKYHRWAYNLDGKLVATPLWKKGDSEELKSAMDTSHVKDFDKNDFPLFPVRVDTLGHLIFVNIDGKAPPLAEYLGDIPQITAEHFRAPDELVSVWSGQYDVKANWKLLVENFIEYLHLPSVHPSLVKLSGMDEHHRLQGTGSYVGFVTSPLTPAGTPGDPYVLPHFPGLSDVNNTRAIFHQMFPNVFYFLLPHSVFTVITMPDPKDPKKTVEHCDLTVHKSALDAPDAQRKIKELVEFYDMTNREDVEVCEGVQQGLGVYEYQGGRLSFKFEETIHRFQNMVIDYMTDRPTIPPGDALLPPGSARWSESNSA